MDSQNKTPLEIVTNIQNLKDDPTRIELIANFMNKNGIGSLGPDISAYFTIQAAKLRKAIEDCTDPEIRDTIMEAVSPYIDILEGVSLVMFTQQALAIKTLGELLSTEKDTT